ncbi:DUF3322 domain-containing protein [Oceanispirochaeta sp.]|jgi:hypothetical protein|uniref:DUF3322 domain-containing protein n=1 Tax=Oceanispirochaeta sp. TaxID=2035350 RepID=UPI0026243B5C|nr:DUF3322 domain-containing protein [Oceanispirochaeta sp.]MDA3955342.1 DUF3322 domain-containing protein [Oceanispirochaeta sp.]
MTWGMPGSIKKKYLKRWEGGSLLSEMAQKLVDFPLRAPLKMPSSSEMTTQFDEVRRWTRQLELESAGAPWTLERRAVNHRQLGENSLPSALLFQESADLLSFLGKKKEFELFLSLSKKLSSAFPVLRPWSLENPHRLLRHASDLDRLIRILLWVTEHPNPGIYVRQLSLEGVDTKFIEQRRGLLMSLLDRLLDPANIDSRFSGVKNFERRYGFTSRPELIRFRYPFLTDGSGSLGGPGNFSDFGAFSDLSVPSDEFCRMQPDVKRVVVVENDISALAFPRVKDTMVLFGRGYHFGTLSEASWLHKKELFYWGDLDSHGFAILAQFRKLFPHTRSILMDRETLLHHEAHWGEEPKGINGMPSGLAREEELLLRDLMENRYGPGVRLEQEFILFSRLEDCLKKLGFHFE